VVAAGATVRDPFSAFEPVQPPEPWHEVAFALDQASVDDEPAAIDGGVAVIVTVGSGAGVTVTVAEALALDPELVQVSV
jgi:hypothetical protein